MKGCLTAIGITFAIMVLGCGGLVILGTFLPTPPVTPIKPMTAQEKAQAKTIADKDRKSKEAAAAKEARLKQIRTRDRQMTREAESLRDELKYERNRFELGETSESQARAIAASLERKIQDLASERKRLENELYEIKIGTWKPPAGAKE